MVGVSALGVEENGQVVGVSTLVVDENGLVVGVIGLVVEESEPEVVASGLVVVALLQLVEGSELMVGEGGLERQIFAQRVLVEERQQLVEGKLEPWDLCL